MNNLVLLFAGVALYGLYWLYKLHTILKILKIDFTDMRDRQWQDMPHYIEHKRQQKLELFKWKLLRHLQTAKILSSPEEVANAHDMILHPEGTIMFYRDRIQISAPNPKGHPGDRRELSLSLKRSSWFPSGMRREIKEMRILQTGIPPQPKTQGITNQ